MPQSAAPLVVVEYGPKGHTEGRGDIFVLFNQPVVALQNTGDVPASYTLELEPALPGRSRFQTPERLIFDSEKELAPAQRYTVRLQGPIQATDDNGKSEPLAWQFETSRPQVVHFEPTDEESESSRTAAAEITFNQRILRSQVASHLKAWARPRNQSTAPEKPVPVRVTVATEADKKDRRNLDLGDEIAKAFSIEPKTLWPSDSEVRLELDAGLPGRDGPLPSTQKFTMRFSIIEPLRLEQKTCTAQAPCGPEPIALHFNNPISLKQAERIRIIPKPEDFDVDVLDKWESGGHEVRISGGFVPGRSYRINVPADLRDEYRQPLGRPQTLTAVFARRPSVALGYTGILRLGHRQTVGVRSRFVKTLKVAVAVLEDHEAAELLLAERSRHKTGERKIDMLPLPQNAVIRELPLQPHGPTDWSSVVLDLAEWSGGARGALVVEVRPTALSPNAQGELPAAVRGVFRITDMAPVLLTSRPLSIASVQRLSNGTPIRGAEVLRLLPKLESIGTTDQHGVVKLSGPMRENPTTISTVYLLRSRTPDGQLDRAYLPVRDDDDDDDDDARPIQSRRRPEDAPASPLTAPGEDVLSEVLTERGTYRPGEPVRSVGWAALSTPYSRSGLRRVPADLEVRVELRDPKDAVVASQRVRTTAEGKFWADLPIPKGASLGRYDVRAELLGHSTEAAVQVEDYRTPEFSVSADVAVSEILAGEDAKLRVQANYFFGGPVSFREAVVRQSCEPFHYRPPALEFAWRVGSGLPREYLPKSSGPVHIPMPRQQGGVSGRLEYTPPRGAFPGHPTRCQLSVAVQDASLQSVGAQTSYLIHPKKHYLALKQQQLVYEGEPLKLLLRAVLTDGTRTGVPAVWVRLVRHYSEPGYKVVAGKRVFDRHLSKQVLAHTCKLPLAESGPDAVCTLPAAKAGHYDIEVSDGSGAGAARTTALAWVYSRPGWAGSAPRSKPEELEIELSADTVQPGQLLGVKVQAPWPGLHGVLLFARNGLRDYLPFTIEKDFAQFTLSVDDSWVPEVKLTAVAVQTHGTPLPRLQTAEAVVKMPADHRQLHVELAAPRVAQPRAEVPIVVKVRDVDAKPVAARVVLWAVDEAVLSLTDYAVPDLLERFLPETDALLTQHDDLHALRLPYSAEMIDPLLLPRRWGDTGGVQGGVEGGVPGGVLGRAPDGQGAVYARRRFETTPLFLADMATGPDGQAQTQLKLPDNLTTFRIIAVASARLSDGQSPGRFGHNDAKLRISQPLVVRAALPRLMRPGDRAEVAALVNNLSGPSGEVRVALQLHGSNLKLTSTNTVARPIASGEILHIPFSLYAERPGVTELELSARLKPSSSAGEGAQLSDAVRLPLAVEVEKTLIDRVATYGTLDDDKPIALPLRIPADAQPGFGMVSLQLSSTLIGDLEGVASALLDYPYECVEQTSSRLLPLVALGNLLPQLHLKSLSSSQVSQRVAESIARMQTMQTESGGFSYWPGGQEPHLYASAYATWVLHLAHQAKHAVPKEMLRRAASYLQQTLEHKALPNDEYRLSQLALALLTLREMGILLPKVSNEIYERRSQLPVFGRALLLLARAGTGADINVLTDELLGQINELPATAHVNERPRQRLDWLFHSATRSDAMVLWALQRVRPQHPLIPKLVRGLLERRNEMAWRNTQENAYALLALSEYARSAESGNKEMVARAWIEKTQIGQARLSGPALPIATLELPLAKLLPLHDSRLILRLEGQGRLYYRLGMEWIPRGEQLPSREQGLHVERTLRTESGPLAVGQPLPPGESVALDLVLQNQAPLDYVAVDVPLPAGLEALQLSLGHGQPAQMLSGVRGDFVSFEERRHDRVLFFADRLQPGKHYHTIFLRATTPGHYALPPVLARTMYAPEIYGRSAGQTVEVR